MTRAPMGNQAYWIEWTGHREKRIQEEVVRISQPSANPTYRPQYVWHNVQNRLRYILTLYSNGSCISDLAQHFTSLLDAWELSNQLAAAVNSQLRPGEGWDHRHLGTAALISNDPRSHNDPRAWDFVLSNLNHYNWCFWLVGLALTLEILDTQWERLVALIGEAGHDILLDRVIASRQPNRVIGTSLLHKKPYARLLAAIDAPRKQQALLLVEFVDHWHMELARKGNEELWWYSFGDPINHSIENGSYFGRWCIEAAVVAKVFEIDDSLCLGHEHYPGDLLRPNGPSTHPQHRVNKLQGLFSKWFGNKRP